MTLFHDAYSPRAYCNGASGRGMMSRLLARLSYVKAQMSQTPEPRTAVRDRTCGFAASFDYIAPHLIEDRRIYVVEGTRRPLFSLIAKIAAPAMSIVSVGDFASAQRAIAGFKYEKALLVLDIDTLGPTSHAVEALIAFRRQCPDTPVVIGSGSFTRHDFSMARGVIADASVRLPCDCVSVARAIESAVGDTYQRPVAGGGGAVL